MTPSDLCLTEAHAGYMVSYAADTVIGHTLRTTGRFQEEEIDHALQLALKLGRPTRLTTFVDVGANIGTHTLWALRQGFRDAVCVEADAGNFKLLRVNQILNDLDMRCRNVHAAASAEDGVGQIERSPTNFGDHRVRVTDHDGLHGEGQRETQPVPTMRLDSILAGAGPIGMVWIDTQGHEGHVLAGARSVLGDPEVPIVAEFWPYGLERSGGYHTFRELLAASNRKAYDLSHKVPADAPRPLDPDRMDELYRSFLSGESASGSPHTNLLLIEPGRL